MTHVVWSCPHYTLPSREPVAEAGDSPRRLQFCLVRLEAQPFIILGKTRGPGAVQSTATHSVVWYTGTENLYPVQTPLLLGEKKM